MARIQARIRGKSDTMKEGTDTNFPGGEKSTLVVGQDL